MQNQPTKPKSDAARRAGRTGVQGGIVALAITGWNLFATTPLTAEQTTWAMGVGTLLVSFIQNLLEQQHVLPELMKDTPPAPDLDDRKLDALAAAIGGQHDRMERLENALIDLRAARRPEPEEPSFMFPEHGTPARPPRG